MKKKEQTYQSEKSSIRDYVMALKGVRIPWLYILLIGLSSIGTTFASLHISFFTGDMVDARGNVPTDALVTFAMSYVGIGIFAAATVIFSSLASEKINLGLRTKLWRKIMYTKQSCYDADGGEALVSRVTTDCDFASRLLTTAVDIIAVAFSMGIYIRRMYRINVSLSMAMFLLIPISVIAGWIYAKLKFLIAQKSQAMLARTTAYLAERTMGLPLIKTANAQSEEVENGKENFRQQYYMQIKTGMMNIVYTCMQTVYSILSILIPFVLGAKLVSEGVISVGQVIAFYSIAGAVGSDATNIINNVGTIRQANGALVRVIETLKLPDEEEISGRTMDDPDQDIIFENVDFSYDEKPVLHHISCTIPKNRITAVVGANGSGKSTLFKLIDRLYEPGSGTVKFGDINAEAYDLHEWRRAFCLVAQGSPLMEGTVRENICYGCQRPVTQEELIKVAKQARVYDFVSQLPDGFETMVSAGGTNFSGGQRQCIAIARAIMNNPDYLLLDEATSSLDSHSERMVLEALQELMKGRTTVIIAHSLSAIRKADHVIVLKDGKVSEQGSPETVLQETDNYLAKVMGRHVQA